jgi:hypothetical protein
MSKIAAAVDQCRSIIIAKLNVWFLPKQPRRFQGCASALLMTGCGWNADRLLTGRRTAIAK